MDTEYKPVHLLMCAASFCAWWNAVTWVPAAVDVKRWYSTLHAAAVAVDC